MVYKTLELTLISAKDLKNVNLIGKMDVYVLVHLSDDPKNKQKTPIHQDGGTNPAWNYTMRFTVDDAAAAKPGKYLVLTLKHESTFGADKDLGEVLLPLKELLEGVKDPSAPQFVTYQVKRVSSGKAQGEFKLSYKFIDMGQNMGGSYDKPVKSSCCSSTSAPYPPSGPGGYGDVYPPPHAASAYPPSHAAASAYPPPHAAASAYPPPHATASGYPPPQQSQAPPAAVGVPYGAPEGYPSQSHGAGYPPQSHGTGYPPQSHGVPYAAGAGAHGYPPYGGYPPQPAGGYGYGYPPPGGYPPQPQAGYAQKPQKTKKNNMGMGLGAGLLGGAIGGLVLGEMMDDAFDVDF